MPVSRKMNQEVLSALTKSKVLNPAVSLTDLMNASAEVSRVVGNDAELAAWTFVSPDYVYTGGDAAAVSKVTPAVKKTIVKRAAKKRGR